MRISFFLILLFSAGEIYAQSNIIESLGRNIPGEGKVTVHQEEAITKLIGGAHRSYVKEEDKSVKSKNKSNHNNNDDVKIEKEGVAPSMDLILDDMEEEAPKKIIKVAGYRVQVYAGNNTRNAKLEALRVASDVRSFFPDVPVYSFFLPPRWLCRVGDFRSMEEAYSMLRKLKSTHVFHEVSIVKDRVNVAL